jgi:antitoxin component YwqK of YwqJK toxin-antitoxin module
MKYDPADTSLYNQLYVRLFSEIMQKDEFETYINYVLKNTNDKSVANWNEKNAEKMKEFISSAQDFINTGRDYGFSAQNEAAGKKIYHFNSEGLLESMGEKLIKGTEEIRQGKWLVISKDGSLSEQGSYRNNKTEGDWYVYWPDRKIKQRLFFKNDELEGTLHTYYPTEAVEGIYSFKEGKKNGLQELYTSSGLLVSRSVVRNNSRHGPGIYNSYDEGYTREFNYINDSLSGKKTEKWITGAPKLECYFDGNEYDSIYRSGYPNSKPETEAFYKQGLLSGKWTKYYPSGIKNEAGEYENGNVTGEYYTYDREGNLLTEQGIYSNGVQNGKWIKFPPNGEKRLILTYVDDTITAVECHDNNGNIIYQANEKEGILQYKSFYPDGILEIEGIFMDGKRDGSWKSYNPQGIIKDDFAYLNSQRAGLQKTFYQNGAIKEEYSCDSDMILGIYHEYYSNGQLKSKGFYDKIGRTGDWFTYYKNDSLETHKFFKNDQLTGRFISYSPTGKKLSELFYNDEGKSIRHINYDPDENVSLDMNYEFGAAEFKESFSNGQVKAIVRVSDNQIHGKQEMYYPNGQLAQLDLYEYGMCHGTSKRWDYNGNLTNEITFVLNIPEGEARWYENNLPDFTCHFEYGQYQGKAYSYYSNGKLYREMNFVDDERHGNADYYSPEGNFMYRIRYYNGCIKGYSYQDKNGALISEIPVDTNLAEIICYYPNGKVAMRIPLKKCMYHGKFVSYYPSGNIFRELTYIDDDIEGKVKEFYSNGELRESVTYLHNTQHGPYTLYHQNGKKFKEGNFILGKEDGIWQIYDDADNLREILKYCNGILYESKKL